VQPVVTETHFNRVFIVDDDDLFRESLGLNLAEEGYEVVDFANGESALEFMMSGEEAEAVLLDWRMPGLDGLAVLRRMRECRIQTPVIFLTVLSDEIYDQMVYPGAEFVPMATLCRDTLCGTFSGLSKIYRACGYRVGWVAFSGALDRAGDYLTAMDLLAALRLCSNVPGQWAVQTALGGYQSVHRLCSPGGRLYESRQAIIEAVSASPFLELVSPRGSMYAFIGTNKAFFPSFDDETFAMELLEQQHVLIAPGSSFNTPYRDHFRITSLPDKAVLAEVFRRMHAVLEPMANVKLESA